MACIDPSTDMASSVPFFHSQTQPLQTRVVRSSGRTPVVVPCPAAPDRPSTYNSYSDQKLVSAVKAVQQGEMSIRRASEEYGVPRSTLQDKVSGKSGLSARPGSHRRLLSDEEERSLADFICSCASIGYAKSRKEVLAIVQQIVHLRKENANTEVSKGWWDSFKRRHPELTLRLSEALSYARAAANNPETINKYFDLLQHILQDNGLTDRPTQLFNCDESGLPLTHKPPKVVARVGQKHPYAVTSSDKGQITILACGNAAGYCIPPMVIFDRKSLNSDWAIGEVPGTFYGLSDSGWMDAELFEEWFKNHFLRHAPPARPLLLLLDGHSSHFQPELVQAAATEGVIIFCLPPHTTHLLQPLDNCAFGSLKRHWGEECHRFCSNNPGKVVNRYNFSSIFNAAWLKGMSMGNIIASFRAAGIYPLNRKAVLSQLPGTSEDIDAPQPHLPVSLRIVPFFTPQQSSHSMSPQYSDLSTSHCMQHSIQSSPSLSNAQSMGTAGHTPSSLQPSNSTFTTVEVRRYRTRLAEGYDLPDPRYAQWVSTLPSTSEHSSSADPHKYSSKDCYRPQSSLEKILRLPTPPAQKKRGKYIKGARILTSEECMQEALEKQEKKKKKEEEKQKRAEERQRKAEEKQKIAEEKKKKKEESERQKAEREALKRRQNGMYYVNAIFTICKLGNNIITPYFTHMQVP